MAEIFLDDAAKTVGATMTDQEYAIVKPALEAPGGKEGLAQMFAAFLQQQASVQREKARRDIITFAERATDRQLNDVLAAINAK